MENVEMWTTNTPSEPGYYWMEVGTEETIIVELTITPPENKPKIWFIGEETPNSLKYMKGTRWLGPIPHPSLSANKQKGE